MRNNSLKDFPLHLQKQIKEKLKEENLQKRKPKTPLFGEGGNKTSVGKYNNTKTIVNGICFDSKKEALRYEELLLMLRSGDISDLRLQVDFTLQEAYTTYEGIRVRAIRYKADFTYIRDGKQVIEDVKSHATKTKVYMMKKKMMMNKFKTEIIEI